MSKKLIFALAVLLLTACGGGGSGNTPKPLSVDIYGDSIAFGVGVVVPPVEQIQKSRPKWVVHDRSAGGLQLRDLMSGYREPYPNAPADVFPRGPQPAFANAHREGKFVVLQVGVNDAFNGTGEFEKNMREAIRIIQGEGRTPVLTGIVGLSAGPIFTNAAMLALAENNALTHRLAEEYGLQHAGWGEDYRGPIDLHPDRIHRTQEASDRLANLLVSAIERARALQ